VSLSPIVAVSAARGGFARRDLRPEASNVPTLKFLREKHHQTCLDDPFQTSRLSALHPRRSAFSKQGSARCAKLRLLLRSFLVCRAAVKVRERTLGRAVARAICKVAARIRARRETRRSSRSARFRPRNCTGARCASRVLENAEDVCRDEAEREQTVYLIHRP